MTEIRLSDMRELAELDRRVAELDRRVNELLEANNALVSERRIAQGRADHYQSAVEYLLHHHGMERMRELETENQTLKQLLADTQHDLRVLRAERDALLDKNEALLVEIERRTYNDP